MNKYIVVATDLECTKVIGTYMVEAESEYDAKSEAEIFVPSDKKHKLYVILPDIENTPAK